ncbi:MAG TPA: cystathionine beta-lyase [Candidatus Bathyarchaeia archaeon]|nr:cystathionine beta-lyase [Candidatus Bathyarchaeia archaeon]
MKFATRLLNFDPSPGDRFTPANTPIYQTATFRQQDATEFGEYDYSRSGNPTRAAVERQIAALESGTRGFCFSTGLAAITAVTRLVRPGEEILACDDLYGGTYRLFSRILANRGIDVRYLDFTDLEAVAAAVSPRTKLVYLETPTNPLLQIIDVAAVSDIAHRAGALACVDNSTLSPYLQRPLELGADIVLHSATKFLCGHSDVMAGAVVVADDELAEELYLIQNGEGAVLAPFDSYLLLRGTKTLALRLDRQQANARAIAEFLDTHPAVKRVYYPGLAEERSLQIHRAQASGDGAVLSFVTGDAEFSRALVEATRLFAITVSFGGVNSTISLPNYMSHASIPVHIRQQKAIPADLVRISVGAEDVEDLVADLAGAFEAARQQTRAAQAVAAD